MKLFSALKSAVEARTVTVTTAAVIHAITFTISRLVLSSFTLIFNNPELVTAAGPVTPATNMNNRIDTSNYHATITISPSSASSPSATVGTPTIQAPLQIPRTLQSTDIVNSLAIYEVSFTTSTTEAIDMIRMDSRQVQILVQMD